LVPKLLSPAPVQKLLQNLLRQRAAIRDAVGILEALGEAAPITKAIVLLKEYVRKAFHSRVVRHLLEPPSDRSAYLLDSLQRAHDMVAA
jgi:flagellar biosynthesis protein FlhA